MDSARELDEYVSLNPLAEITQWEVHNVSTLDESIAVVEKMREHPRSRRKAA